MLRHRTTHPLLKLMHSVLLVMKGGKMSFVPTVYLTDNTALA